jgi:hypothetical protein
MSVFKEFLDRMSALAQGQGMRLNVVDINQSGTRVTVRLLHGEHTETYTMDYLPTHYVPYDNHASPQRARDLVRIIGRGEGPVDFLISPIPKLAWAALLEC